MVGHIKLKPTFLSFFLVFSLFLTVIFSTGAPTASLSFPSFCSILEVENRAHNVLKLYYLRNFTAFLYNFLLYSMFPSLFLQCTSLTVSITAAPFHHFFCFFFLFQKQMRRVINNGARLNFSYFILYTSHSYCG